MSGTMFYVVILLYFFHQDALTSESKKPRQIAVADHYCLGFFDSDVSISIKQSSA